MHAVNEVQVSQNSGQGVQVGKVPNESFEQALQVAPLNPVEQVVHVVPSEHTSQLAIQDSHSPETS